MAMFLKQDESRSELQQKIAADVAERQRAAAAGAGEQPDGVEDSQFVKGTTRGSRLGLIVIILFVLFAVATVIVVSLPR